MEQNWNRLIRSRMKWYGLTFQDLSNRTGYSKSYLCDLLIGRKRWNIETMETVGEAVGIEIRFVSQAG